ncbi:LysR family transcriptional regulator [Nocardia sp. NPDC052566]|uniref:LysR family transcriptional regulator n=1 Tax=Nocardia sp. NPDC052566 TaxID=3364330 RepID=UPI0037C98A50
MELRDIEIFLTLAEELHFGRTAQRLHVSPARISQAIKKQERMVGADLFERTSRTVRLTTLGEQLRDDLQPLYRGLNQSVAKARLAAQGKDEVLRIGTIAANTHELRPFWDAFRARHPQWGLQIRHNPFVDPFAPLRNGEIDALITWLPIEEPDLTVGPVLFTEPKTLLVAAGHELADRKSVPAETRGNYSGATSGSAVAEYWEDAFNSFYTPSGRPVDKVAEVTNLEDILLAVVHDGIVHTMGAHGSRYFARPDVVYLDIEGEPRLTWALIWRSDADNARIRALAEVIRDLGQASF